MISGVILAAGAAHRMGRQKLFLDFRGKPVLRWTVEAAIASRLSEIVCVVRDVERCRARVPLSSERLRWVGNDRADGGLSTSVGAGIRSLSPASEAALFQVGDQPLVTVELIDGVIRLYEERKPVLLVASRFEGQTRSPVLFHRNLFPELLKLTGDRGGRELIELYRDEAAFLDWEDERPFRDVDTWGDYEKLRNLPDR